MIEKVNKSFNTIFAEANENKFACSKLWGHIQILQDCSPKLHSFWWLEKWCLDHDHRKTPESKGTITSGGKELFKKSVLILSEVLRSIWKEPFHVDNYYISAHFSWSLLVGMIASTRLSSLVLCWFPNWGMIEDPEVWLQNSRSG